MIIYYTFVRIQIKASFFVSKGHFIARRTKTNTILNLPHCHLKAGNRLHTRYVFNKQVRNRLTEKTKRAPQANTLQNSFSWESFLPKPTANDTRTTPSHANNHYSSPLLPHYARSVRIFTHAWCVISFSMKTVLCLRYNCKHASGKTFTVFTVTIWNLHEHEKKSSQELNDLFPRTKHAFRANQARFLQKASNLSITHQ